MPWLVVLIAVLNSMLAQAARDLPKPNPTTASATIRGRITDQESGNAVPRALATAFSPERKETIETEADAEGRYEFAELQSGRYAISAEPGQLRATHIRNYFGVVQGHLTIRPPELTLKPGEVRDQVDIALARALAIEGRVVDPAGEPMTNVSVAAFNVRSAMQSESSLTDERGMFRVFGLPAGRYRVCADPRVFELAEDQSPERYSRTCAASAIVDSEADIITLRREVTDIRISVQRRATYTVSGTVADSTGSAVTTYVSVIPLDSNERGAGGVANAGLFTASGLLPGRYAVRATVRGPTDPGDMRPAPDMEIGFVPIQVQAADVTGIAVTTVKGATVAGRLVFEGERAPSSGQRVTVFVRHEGDASHVYGSRPPMSPVGQNSRFVLAGLFGRNTLAVQGLPQGWVLRAIRYKGADITDLPTEFTTGDDPHALEIVLTDRAADLSARVVDGDGRAVTDCAVLLFAVDPARRTGLGSDPWTHKIQGDTVQLGRYRAGDYFVAAVSMEDYAWVFRDPSRSLDALARVARRITLTDGDKRTIDLTLVEMDTIR